VLTSVTPASSAPVLQTPKATSSTLYFDSLTVNAGNGGFLHCIQMDTSVNAANQVVSVGADIAFRSAERFITNPQTDLLSFLLLSPTILSLFPYTTLFRSWFSLLLLQLLRHLFYRHLKLHRQRYILIV